MDANEVRSILRETGVDVWTLIDSAISVASIDNRHEMKQRRDGVVERLYASVHSDEPPLTDQIGDEGGIRDKEENNNHIGKLGSPPLTPQCIEADEDQIDDEQIKILDIKEHLEDPHQSEDSLVNLLQELADMDITFKALQETDIGRHVNRLRKHPSSEVRRLVKQLVRKWKDLVDRWVKLSSHGENASSASTLVADGDSPQPRSSQNSHHQVPDFAYSPNVHNGSSGSDKNNSEPEPKPKVVPRRELQSHPKATQSAPPPPRKETAVDPERLASARRRLQENYQEANNAKRNRTIQVMDLQDIPKPKNNFFGRNKGGFQSKHW